MPFGGYKDFNECMLKNKGKKSPEAYCGYIKNKVEGADAMENKMILSTADLMDAEKELAEVAPDATPIPASSAQSWATFKVGFDKGKKKCPSGKAIDPKTGKCVPCPGGKIRSEGKGRGLGIGGSKGPLGNKIKGRGRMESADLETADSQLSMGKKVEKEHQPTYNKVKSGKIKKNKDMFESIAKDHINEFPKYYTGLKKMESGLKKKETAESDKDGITQRNYIKNDKNKYERRLDINVKKKKEKKQTKIINFASYAEGLRENTEEMIKLTRKVKADTEKINEAARSNALGNIWAMERQGVPQNSEDYAYTRANREKANIKKQMKRRGENKNEK